MFQQNQPTIKNQVQTWSRDLTAKYAEGKKVGELLWPQYSATQQLLSIVNPTTKLRYNILIPEVGRVPIGECQIDDAVSRQVVVKAACGYVEQVAAREWKKKHDAMVKKLPRRPPVVYGNVKSITRNMVGTYIIPREAPPTEKTITWTETVWANAHGTGRTASGERVGVDVSVPVGERTCSRTKKISSAMKYDQLKQQLEEYEAQVRAIENDKPPKADEDAVLEKLQSGCELIFSIKKK